MFQPSTPKKFLTIRTNDCILVFSNVACWKKTPENRQIYTIYTINMATHRITILYSCRSRTWQWQHVISYNAEWIYTYRSKPAPTTITSISLFPSISCIFSCFVIVNSQHNRSNVCRHSTTSIPRPTL